MPEPLPVRTDPLPGEFWGGYLQRVATRFGITSESLLRPLGVGGSARDRPRTAAPWPSLAGVCVLPTSARELAAYLRIDPTEVAAMHLETAIGSPWVNVSDRHRHALDVLNRCGSDGLRTQCAGPIWSSTVDVRCPRCWEQRPGLVKAVWRIATMPACRDHGELLEVSGRREAAAASPSLLDAQEQLTSWATGPIADRRWRFELVETGLRRASPTGNLRLAEIADRLPGAVLNAAGVGYPHAQGLVNADATWAQRRRIPREPHYLLRAPEQLRRAERTSRLHQHPVRIPATLVPGPLNDLLITAVEKLPWGEHLQPPPERIAAIGSAMIRFGCPLAMASGGSDNLPGDPPNIDHRVLTTLCIIEQEGRLERFWQVCADLTQRLVAENIDYDQRFETLDDGRFVGSVFRSSGVDYAVAATWLFNEWAPVPNPTAWLRFLKIDTFRPLPRPTAGQDTCLRDAAERAAATRHVA